MTLEIKDLRFGYRNREVVKDLCLSIGDGEMISLMGRNGAGKTTLLRLIAGFLNPSSGSIAIDGKPVGEMKLTERARYMAYIPQITRSAFPYSVRTSILMGASNRLSFFQTPGEKEEKRVDEIIDLLQIGNLADRNMENISGGERQLVLIARALLQDARLLILDEPTSFLDYSNQILVLEKIGELVEKGYSCIYSTHNPELALMHSSRVVVMKNGTVSFDGEPGSLVGNDVLSDVYGRKIEVIRTERGNIVCVPE
ncbi:MAG: ABC transporter ATP-binding protein [Spirochaetales bacterium]|nr:ABC transporter ATP-binding protein [Spirochaetales bacterium]